MKLPVVELSPVVTSCATLPSGGAVVEVVNGGVVVGSDAVVVRLTVVLCPTCPSVVFTKNKICIL